MKKDNTGYGFATRALRSGEWPDLRDGSTGDVVVPIHLSTTYIWKNPGQPHSEFEYTRSQNPTRKAYETKLASLERAGHALAFSSGLAAENAIMQAFLYPGHHVITFDDLYGGTRRLLDDVVPGIETSYIDLSDIERVNTHLRPNTRMIWVESPTNPVMKICDIRQLSDLAKKKNILLVVDNTFLSPYFQNPLDLGADIVVHSSTKYIGGHSDVLGGAVLTSDPELYHKLHSIHNNAGAVLSPFDSYMNLRGLKTLALRMERHQWNAMEIARFLNSHPKVNYVLYPGLETHPGHEILKKQASGFGGMLSFELNASLEETENFISRLKLFTLAESLGGVESLVELPSKMTHVSVDRDVRIAVGISDSLIRMSVGVENIEDLIADLKQALN